MVTLIYTCLYFIFLDGPTMIYPSPSGHIAGFFGLFAPIGVLSLLTGLLSPLWFAANLVALGLIGLIFKWGSKLQFNVPLNIILSLVALLIITIIADAIRLLPFMSWQIFINGTLPPIS